MKNAQKPDHITLNVLIDWLKAGRFEIPDFQREFEWKPWDIRELMRSIFLDYYIGSLLLWKGKKENFEALSCEPIYGYGKPEGRREFIVLDGQQRLTALYYAFLSPEVNLPGRSNRAVYYICVDKFMAGEHDQAFHYDWFSKRLDVILNSRKSQFANHIFPLDIVGSGMWGDLPKWAEEYEEHWRKEAKNAVDDDESEATRHADNAKEFGVHLKEITQQYQISFIELDEDLEIDKVCDIFTQINSRGVRLDVFDLMNALLKPKGLQLKKMWREAEPLLRFVETDKMNVYILQVMSILRQGYCSPKYLYFLLPGEKKQVRDSTGAMHKEVLVSDITEFENHWATAVNALESAIDLLKNTREFGAISSKYLPYVSIIPVFAALQKYAETLQTTKRLDAQRKIRYWYWASVFLNRYSGAVESTSARDFLDVKAWFESDNSEPSLIEEFKQHFKNLELRKEVKSSTSVYKGIFNLLVLQDARDWITGKSPMHNDLDDHHIVPASWGKKYLKGNLINTILNRTPLTSETNRNFINDQLPNTYLREMINNNDEKSVNMILESHLISPTALEILLRDPFTPDDFDTFITERRRTLLNAIENLLIKERLDLQPVLRELDENIEKIEITLRQVVDNSLSKNPVNLPSHVLQKIEQRLERARKKNPAFDTDHYQGLIGKLEFCDLRELQDVITNKTTWPKFESCFMNKETLMRRFDQLAELRNSIRHSRKVDEITRSDGDAAIRWFQEVLVVQ